LSKETARTTLDLLGDPVPEQAPAGRRNDKRERAATVDEHELTHRDFLTEGETERLLAAAKGGRFGARDYTMLLLMFRHGLRVSELIGLRRADVDLDVGRLRGQRKKEELSTTQPIQGG